MERFIRLIGREKYDLLLENGRRQNAKGAPFDDLVPIVKIVCPYEESNERKNENDFCLLTELSEEIYNDAAVYGLHTFRTGFREVGWLMVQDIVEFRGYNNIALQLDEEFKAEKTLREYSNHYSFRLNGLPRPLWHHINKKEEVIKFHQKELEMIEQTNNQGISKDELEKLLAT